MAIETTALELLHPVAHIAGSALQDIEAYFSTHDDQQDTRLGERADKALKLLASYSRIRATRANEMSVLVVMAKMMNLKGEHLAPLWQQLVGTQPEQLDAPTEQHS